MATKTGLALLPKVDRKIAVAEIGKRVRKVRDSAAGQTLINGAVNLGGTVVAASIDHKFRKGDESEAKLGTPGVDKFRPSINGSIGLVGLIVGAGAAIYRKPWAGMVLSGSMGLATPALYNAVRNQLAK